MNVGWTVLAGLLIASAFFSASETALFSLTSSDRARAGPRVPRLLADSRGVLVTILVCNLVINVLFFALAARFLPHSTGTEKLASGLGALLCLLLAGEILPKTLALRSALTVARLVALPLSLCASILTPVRAVVGILLDLCLRLLGESERIETGISSELLAQVLERSAREGVLRPGEADLLAEIVELESLRVREIMTPRVDLLTLDMDADDEARSRIVRDARRRGLTWVPAVRGAADDVAGQVALRDLVVHPSRPLAELVMPVKFVPEMARALALLHDMRDDRVAEAVVVDEWGGTAGIVTLEDLFEELVGELRVEGEELEKPVVPLGEGRFRVSGGLSIRDWNDLLGARVVPNEFETVGGFVTALLGRLPRSGDRLELAGGLLCEVGEVRGRRVQTLDLFVESGSGAHPDARRDGELRS